MKLLAVEIMTNNRVISKGYLNFLVLKGWKGEKYEGYLDVKKDNKKMG